MFETFTIAFTTLFATIGPLDLAAIYGAMTHTAPAEYRKSMAYKGVAVAAIILVAFALIGEFLLKSLGISLAALKVGGGILLLLISIDMVFSIFPNSNSTEEEKEEAASKQDISVFPLATPFIAGPGAMGAIILLMADTKGDYFSQLVIIGALFSVLIVTLVLLLIASQIQKIIGVTGMHVITRIFGVLLTALAVQFMLNGIHESMLFARSQ